MTLQPLKEFSQGKNLLLSLAANENIGLKSQESNARGPCYRRMNLRWYKFSTRCVYALMLVVEVEAAISWS